MAKRFIDTNLGREAWYRKLKPAFKCTWNFLCAECDSAGVWTIDEDAILFYVGEEINIDDFIIAVNIDKVRIERFGDNKIFITGFVDFQYGELSEKCKPHLRIIQLLKKYNLYERVCKGYTKSINTLEEKEEDKDKEEDKEERGSGGKQKSMRSANIKPQSSDQKVLRNEYTELLKNLEEVHDMREKKLQIAEFISTKRPEFIEPYMDLWNLSAFKHKLPSVEKASTGRVKKFNTRIREPEFDFVKILTEINNSAYLQGKTTDWKVDFDWVIENDTNYIKIIEGKYANTTR